MKYVNLFGRKIKAKDVVNQSDKSVDSVINDLNSVTSRVNSLSGSPKLYMVTGTTTLTNSSQSVHTMHSFSDVQSMFRNKYDVAPSSIEQVCAVYRNGWTPYSWLPVTSVFINGSNEFVVGFRDSTSGTIKIDWTYFYMT